MKRDYKIGMIAAISCSVLWGFLPIYWKMLKPIDSTVIIYYRIFLVFITAALLSLKLHSKDEILTPLKSKGVKLRYFIIGLLITLNWSIYIWAVNAGFVIQTSIGYYIEPLLVAVLGIIIFKEKLTSYKGIALAMAFIGVMVLIVYYGEVPSIALSLAFTFAIYAALKKNFSLPPTLSLLYETMFLALPSLGVIIYLEIKGQGALGVGEPYQYVLLLFCGLLTAIPLWLFALAANKITLLSLGLTEYLSPTIALLLGIFLFREPFDKIQLISFAIIWVGLFVFTLGEVKEASTLETGV